MTALLVRVLGMALAATVAVKVVATFVGPVLWLLAALFGVAVALHLLFGRRDL